MPTGLWLYWCDVDGYTKARCSCSSEKTWFPNWSAAEKADRDKRALPLRTQDMLRHFEKTTMPKTF